MLINKNRYIIGINDSREGHLPLRQGIDGGLPDLGRWMHSMISGRHAGELQPIILDLDGGYAGIVKYRGIRPRIPHKKPKGEKLSATKKHRPRWHLRRVIVENVFAYIRN